ncbi:KDO2-lipid IV(A) lauroyltransferase [Haloactinospora alba]|uniref:KDO2-lipid IV(A) lauroyltransferase n=1 Tax=Haloactinospora alba TaxID=405555 RepID=A0A543NHB6_9ACTN|nr:phosphatidylinositol mannoside acyltransferase [Haloactinospora alba]TQN31237.1 KDO2-lipid IV(A) lauroyltransferase [Haloactinospora alba]
MGERATTVAYSLGWMLIRRVPERVGRRVFEVMADRSWRGRGRRVRQLEANLRRVSGPDITQAQLRALSRAAMRSYLRYFYEMFRLPVMDWKTLSARTSHSGVEKVERHARAGGRGAVVALPHMGNWDHAGAWITMRGTPLTTVAERLEPESLFDRFVRFRAALGMEVLPLTGGEGNNTELLARRLRNGGLVCLLADRDLTSNGVDVTFFGENARMPAGPASLAERTGAALLPVTLWYEGEQCCIRIHDEVPVPGHGDRRDNVRAMTQEVARVFEHAIAEHPQDWHMLQRVFTADLEEPGTTGAASRVPESDGPDSVPPRDGDATLPETGRETGRRG